VPQILASTLSETLRTPEPLSAQRSPGGPRKLMTRFAVDLASGKL